MAARRFQVSSRFPFEYHGWKKRGTTPIEDLSWQPYVPLESDGKVLLSKDSIMRIAMINSRDYQFAYRKPLPVGPLADAGAVPVHDPGLQQLGRVLFAADRRTEFRFNTPDDRLSATISFRAARRGIDGRGRARARPSRPNLNNQLQLTAANGFTART